MIIERIARSVIRLADEHLQERAISLENVKERIARRGHDVPKVVVIDADYTNAPVADALKRATGDAAATQVMVPNVVYYYAQGPGVRGAPAAQAPSPFVAALAKEIGGPPNGLLSLLMKVTKAVGAATNGRQLPWVESLATDEFFFAAAPLKMNRPAP